MLTSVPHESSHPSSQPVPVSIVSTPRNRAALAIALVAVLAFVLLSPFVSGLFGALVLYVIARGPYQRFARRLAPGLSAVLVILALHILVIAPLIWFVIQLIDEAPRAIAAAHPTNLLAGLSHLRIGSVDIGAQISSGTGSIVSWLSTS
jgi:predicted PurR-regulated permease PerM